MLSAPIPLGPVLTAMVESGPAGITRVGLDLAPGEPARPLRLQMMLGLAMRLAGLPFRFDLSGVTEDQHSVWRVLRTIPMGAVASYGWVAAAIGRPEAPRAIGSVNRSNRFPILVPCHRVVHADGRLGGFFGQPEVKSALLLAEDVLVTDGVVQTPVWHPGTHGPDPLTWVDDAPALDEVFLWEMDPHVWSPGEDVG